MIVLFTHNKFLDVLLRRILGKSAMSACVMARQVNEESLSKLSATEWCVNQEKNVYLLETLQDSEFRHLIKKTACSLQLEEEKLRILAGQNFLLGLGKKILKLRLVLTLVSASVTKIASELPEPLIVSLSKEYLPQRNFQIQTLLSRVLRLTYVIKIKAQLLAKHGSRIIRMFKLLRLPLISNTSVHGLPAWIKPAAGDVKYTEKNRFSLISFLEELVAESGTNGFLLQAQQRSSVEGVICQESFPPLLVRPSAKTFFSALLLQCKLLIQDLMSGDYRRFELISGILLDIPLLQLWFSNQAPSCVYYSNSTIGGEPPVALLKPRFGVSSMMVYYSANIAHRYSGVSNPFLKVELEPEQRYVIADYLTMWSDKMREVFVQAGYAENRLLLSGPIIFASQKGFRPTGRKVLVNTLNAPVRIGVFDVSPCTAQFRFEHGYGQLIYNPQFTTDFFNHIVSTAKEIFGDNFKLVRKIKRELDSTRLEVFDATQLKPEQIVFVDPAENLWKMLANLDLVVCMPFTSVAYIAAEYGIPACYYDPSAQLNPSKLGGAAVLVSGIDQLRNWVSRPNQSSLRNPAIVNGISLIKGISYAGI